MGWMHEPTAVSFGVASVLWFFAAFVPGYLVATVVDPWRPALDRWAVAPLVSVGIAFPLAAGAGSVGIPGSIWWAPTGLLVVSVASTLVLTRRPRSDQAPVGWELRRSRYAVVGATAVSVPRS